MEFIVGLLITFLACITSIIILHRKENKKTRKTSDILFYASIQEDKHYTAKEVFENLSEAGIELNFLGNQSNP